MASWNTSPSSKSPDCSEIHDTPIVPPLPVLRKDHKEVVPDISMVSDVTDNGYQLPNFQSNYKPIQVESKEHMLTKSNPLLTSYHQQLELDSRFSKKVKDAIERTSGFLDHNSVLPDKLHINTEYLHCDANHAVMVNKDNNEHFVLPKNSRLILLTLDNEQSDQKMNCKSEESVPFNSNLGESRKSEEICIKETVNKNILKNRNLLCPICWKRTCVCDSPRGKYNPILSKNDNDTVQITEKVRETPNLNGSSSELSIILEYLKQQNEKIDSIHEKVLNFLSLHASCCGDRPPQGKESSNEAESDIPYILNILEVHSDKIRDLEDQLNLLTSSEQKCSPENCNNKNDESKLNLAQMTDCVNVRASNKNIYCPCSHNVVCHEQKQKVTKASTSTMTSFAIENSEKLVYREQLTVVTDVTREKNESSDTPKEDDSPISKNNINGKIASLNSKKSRSNKINKHSPKLKSSKNVSSNSSDVPDSNDNQMQKTFHKSERKSKHGMPGNKIIDKRHVNDRPSTNELEEQKHSPTLKTTAHKSHSSKEKLKQRTSRKILDVETIRDHGNKKGTRQISASSSSTDSDFNSPKQKQKVLDEIELDSEEDSTTIKKYGLLPGDLSVATKQYLDSYGLNLTNDRTGSFRKASLSRRCNKK